MVNSYTMGKVVRLSATFTGADGTLADPATVTVKVLDPTGTQVVSTAPTRDSTGTYHYDYTIPSNSRAAGTWAYRFESSGAGPIAASTGYFSVPVDPFYD